MKRAVFTAALMCVALCSFAQHPIGEPAFKEYFTAHQDSLSALEGIWSVSTTQEYYRYDTLYDVQNFSRPVKVAVLKEGEKFVSYGLDGEHYNVEFSTTDVKGVYLYRNYFPETKQFSKTHAVISKSGDMEYTYEFPDDYLRIRLGVSYEEGTRVVNILRWTRTFPSEAARKK